MSDRSRDTLFSHIGIGFAVLVSGLVAIAQFGEPRVRTLHPSLGDPRLGAAIPPVRLCTDAIIREAEVREALDYWAGLGFTTTFEVGDCLDTCAFEVRGQVRTTQCALGHIAVTHQDGGFDPAHAGEALLRPSARVVLVPFNRLPGWKRGLALRHELGHAFNFSHPRTFRLFEPSGHVMNSNLVDMGDDTRGLEIQ